VAKSWYWSLTPQSLTRLLSEVFDTTEFVVESKRECFARSGLPAWPRAAGVSPAKLSVNDAAYPVIVTARARNDARRRRGVISGHNAQGG